MKASTVRGLTATGIIVVPVLIWAFIKFGTSQQFHSLPFVYPANTGDSAKCGVSDFLLQTADGKPFTQADMAGTVWVVGFFNRADTLRFPISRHFLEEVFVNADAIKAVRFLWVAQVASADSMASWKTLSDSLSGKTPGKWMVATGTPEAVEGLVKNLHLPEYDDSLSGKPYSYAAVSLVDKQGFARGGNNYVSKKGQIPSGYYLSTKDFDMRKLKEDMRALMLIEYPQDMKK